MNVSYTQPITRSPVLKIDYPSLTVKRTSKQEGPHIQRLVVEAKHKLFKLHRNDLIVAAMLQMIDSNINLLLSHAVSIPRLKINTIVLWLVRLRTAVDLGH